jgi:hypothetical protein
VHLSLCFVCDCVLTVCLPGFLEKVKSGKAHVAGSGFGGKGLDRLDKERDAREKAERKAYGEPEEEAKQAEDTAGAATGTKKEPAEETPFGAFKVEIKRGPAPDSNKGMLGVAGAAAVARRLAHQREEERIQSSLRAAEEAAARAGKDSPAHKQANSVVAKLNAQMRAHKLAQQAQLQADDVGRKVNPDSTDFHAIIPINDYPQKARWRVTNKETMVQVRAPIPFILFVGAWVLIVFFPCTAHRYDRRVRHEQGHLLRAQQGAAIRRSAQAAPAHRVERGVAGASPPLCCLMSE